MRTLMHEARRRLASPARTTRMAVVIGRLLGLAFLVCFGTGLYSHFLQDPLPWMRFPTAPVSLYRVTQGIHITAGIACVPLLLAKLWIVFPELLTYPPVTGVVSFLERASIAVFVGASLLEVTMGLLNTFQWVPFPFYFRQTHYALAFVVIGSLAIHIGVKLPAIAGHWRRGQADESPIVADAPDAAAPDAAAPAGHAPRGITGRVTAWIDGTPVPPTPVARRGFLVTVGASVAAVVALTAGQSFRILAPFNAFGPRVMGTGPQALPVNRTAEAAGVTETAVDPGWTLTVSTGSSSRAFTMDDLRAMELVTATLPIACVEGWSQSATWRGVRLKDLMDAVGADPGARLRVTSLEERGGFRRTEMGPEYVRDPLTLVALELDGAPLDIQHGYPARMIAPGRPGVLQTKWLSTLEAM
ncbi:molybdopterin-binding protein [Clavibacter tessellarius]|uniref:Molybdopterin-binding protein n=1 Tax=Clavibacter tessellarius TaxID=31965 RepID=A0A225CL08_9MICO|nr:molybdopterin-dependent oxidoreductase [Clavibacter michiganensis]OQJ63086.1 molybdopterin-binding protein [Clavibacter michiganensis subsp. tessellarius]UKF33929.1 molybdopterin-binding protein [Clavibacter michiganensis subsp. tessellarius]